MELPEGYENNVFINCPFDEEYKHIFDALVFAVYDCGHVARCAKEIGDVSRARIDNIAGIIRECKFGIHDISRTELDEVNGLPRFNMPFELGLFLGAVRFGDERQQEKRTLVLDRDQYRFQKYISDIAGQDIKPHDNDYATMIKRVRDWLSTEGSPQGGMLPGGRWMVVRYDYFKRQLPAQCEQVHIEPEELTFNEFATMVVGWLEENPWW